MPSPEPAQSRRARHLLDPARRSRSTSGEREPRRSGNRTRAIAVTATLSLCAAAALVAAWATSGSDQQTTQAAELARTSDPSATAPAAAPYAPPASAAPATANGLGAGLPAAEPVSAPVTRAPEKAPPARAATPAPRKVAASPAKPVKAAGAAGKKITIDLTGYSFQDNTPAGSAEVSNPILHKEAGGTGTFSDPITVAVPSDDSLSPGTKLYVAKVKRYVIVEDTGASSASDGADEHLDMWSDGEGASEDEVNDCMSQFTGTTTAELKPPSGRPVLAGPIYSKGVCRLP